VLVVTSLEDVTADLVIDALNRRAVPVVRVDPADIRASLAFAARIGDGGGRWGGDLRTGSRDLDLAQVRSVYHRRPGPWRFEHLSGQARDFSTAEARHGLGGLLAALPVLQANHPLANARAEYKPAQLQVASELGFTVPATLITNDLAAAREFAAEYRPVVYKTFRGVPPAGGYAGAIWTQRIEAADLEESLAVTAHLFQEEIDKIADARVTVVGRRVFASLIETPDRLLDWRAGDWDQLSCTPVDVPDPVVKAIYRYLDRFGLVFGCFDFAVDHDRHWHWIECNPNGQWGFLPDSGCIADAFAALLQAG
jgi:ATP-grasp ribosomal peptide maturase